MGLKGKLVAQIEIKVHEDIFHEIFRHRPHQISGISPTKIQGVDLHEGDIGTVGSILIWKFTHGGKEEVCKTIVEAIDETKKQVRFKAVEGDLPKLYSTFYSMLHIENDGKTTLLTWTLEYEKVNENVPEPFSYLEFAVNLCKDIEDHHLK